MSETTTALRAWLDQAWQRHPDAPRAVADDLAARAASLADDADGAEAVRLAEHTLLAHLDDSAALQAFLESLPPAAALAPAIARARWALAKLAGTTSPELPELPELPAAARWRGLHSVLAALARRGRCAEAREMLLSDEASAADHADVDARKAYAATAHNLALDLRLGLRGDAARDALMIEAAELEKRAWTAATGHWMHIERADYHLALCHAVLGQGGPALAHAQACLDCCVAQGAEPSERFFAHECGVHAQRAAGNIHAAQAHHDQMVALLAQVSDEGMLDFCRETLART
jgi:hypothetical protein